MVNTGVKGLTTWTHQMEAAVKDALENLGSASELQQGAAVNSAVSGKPEDYVNDVSVEQLWAIKAVKYAETHFKLIQSRDASSLRLTKIDDDVYSRYMATFPDLKYDTSTTFFAARGENGRVVYDLDSYLPIKIDVLDPDSIKTPEAKEAWRLFCNHFEGKVHDFNFATLLRLDVSKDYSEENTIVAPRAQFLAIEIARNRTGLNSPHFLQSNS